MNAEFGFANPAATFLRRLNEAVAKDMASNGDNSLRVRLHIEEYPEMSDTRRARLLGVTKFTIQKWRSRLHVPAFTHKLCKQCGEVREASGGFYAIDEGDGYTKTCKRCYNGVDAWPAELKKLMENWKRA